MHRIAILLSLALVLAAPVTPRAQTAAPQQPTVLPEPPAEEEPAAQPPAPTESPTAPASEAPAEEKKGPIKRAVDAAKDVLGLKTAKELFSAVKRPTAGPVQVIGYYPRGCIQGAVELPITGPTWQHMRLSRNRNWGHPDLVNYIKKFSARAKQVTGWPGILVGDLGQPRGGPTPSSHTSHQTGLDVDIWFVPMPNRILTPQEREETSANNLVAESWKEINPKEYTPQHMAFVKAATEFPEVDRILINAAIKKKMCETATGDRRWLGKIRPWYGHHDHIHVRLKCPAGQTQCKGMASPPPDAEGCTDADFKFWFTKALEPKKPSTKPPKPLMLKDYPPACKAVLAAAPK
ncbi:MAG: penicillin-insensitive murein endopeptidase [Pseudolabrys sp.]|nr:penicillin-insensitive murein endopeptidase [Pseudolabrys sp.]